MRMPARTSRGGTPWYQGPKTRGPIGQPRPNQGNRGDQRRIEPRKPPTGFGNQVPHNGRHSPAAPYTLQRIAKCPRCSTGGLVSGGRACTTGAPDVGTRRLLHSPGRRRAASERGAGGPAKCQHQCGRQTANTLNIGAVTKTDYGERSNELKSVKLGAGLGNKK